MKKIQKQFTMVEIIISLGIMTIAMFTLVGLMPAGLENTQDTENSIQAPAVAKQVGALLDVSLNGDISVSPSANWAANFDLVEEDRQYYGDDTDLPDNDASGLGSIPSAQVLAVAAWDSQLVVNSNIANDPFYKDLKLYIKSGKLYGGRYTSTISGATDLDYAIRIYNASFDIETTSGSNRAVATPDANDDGVLYTIEITWPVQMPYERRLAMGNIFSYDKSVEKINP